jgi:histidine triad (HIT) family protein
MECIFCRIIAGEIPADVVFQDKDSMAFKDIHPQSPTHILIIPKSHIASMEEANQEHQDLLGHLLLVAKKVAEKENISHRGYRLTINCGPDGGQIVPHLHIHLLGGRRLDDLMG